MRYIIIFIFSIIATIKPQECTLDVNSNDGNVFHGSASGKLMLKSLSTPESVLKSESLLEIDFESTDIRQRLNYGKILTINFESGYRINLKSIYASMGYGDINKDAEKVVFNGNTDDSMITILDYHIIRGYPLDNIIEEQFIETQNLRHPTAKILEVQLERGWVQDINGIAKAAPAIFSLLYGPSESSSYLAIIESQANQLVDRFRDGKDFTREEYTLGMLTLQSITREEYTPGMLTLQSIPKILGKYFSAERTEAIYATFMRSPLRPGNDFTLKEQERAIKILKKASQQTQEKTELLAILRKKFFDDRAFALYQSWQYRPGDDFTEAEFDRAMHAIQNNEDKTLKSYLETLQQEFPPERAFALSKKCWQYRPGDDFTDEELHKAMAIIKKMILAAEDYSEFKYLRKLQEEFSHQRARSLYQRWTYRPGNDFTETELHKTSEIVQSIEDKTQESYLKALAQKFSRYRAQALSQAILTRADELRRRADELPNRFRDGNDFTPEEYALGQLIFDYTQFDCTQNAFEAFHRSFSSPIISRFFNGWNQAPVELFQMCFPQEMSQMFFSRLRSVAIYAARFSNRPGTDFTKAEFYKMLEIFKGETQKTKTACLQVLQETFPKERSQALFDTLEFMVKRSALNIPGSIITKNAAFGS